MKTRAYALIGGKEYPLRWLHESDMDQLVNIKIKALPVYIDLRERVWPEPAEGVTIKVRDDS